MRYSAKRVIEKTFRKLIQGKSIDKITVTEVCDLCRINRQTFYNHYPGLIDIFKFIFKEELFQLIAKDRTLDTWHGGFLATMNYLKNNTNMIMNVYESSYRLETSNFFADLSNELMRNVMEECIVRKQIDLDATDFKFMISFYRHVFNGLMMDWVNEGMKEEPELLLKKLKIMLDGSIMKFIEIFAERERNNWL